jgi:sulfopyruvate decarboxylase alpha subunit
MRRYTQGESDAAKVGRRGMSWPDIIIQSLREHDVRLIAYVPDSVTWRVLSKLEDDPTFRLVPATREDEAMGIIAGAYAAKKRGAVFMQSGGLGNCVNALGSLCIPDRIPFPMFITLRGELGEFNMAQIPLGKAVAPILDVLGLQHFTPTREEELRTMLDGAIQLCYAGRLPVGLLLSTLLTGGKDGAS